MVDVKNFLSPKVIFPVVGICVLLVVGVLVAVFYVRNPTVTDNLFNSGETTGLPDEDHRTETIVSLDYFLKMAQTTGAPLLYTGGNGTAGSYSIDQKPFSSAHDSKSTTHETTCSFSAFKENYDFSSSEHPFDHHTVRLYRHNRASCNRTRATSVNFSLI